LFFFYDFRIDLISVFGCVICFYFYFKGPSWPWSYSSFYNYLYNQRLSNLDQGEVYNIIW